MLDQQCIIELHLLQITTMKIYKHTERLKELNSKYPYVYYLHSAILNICILFIGTRVYLSILLVHFYKIFIKFYL